MWKSIRRLCARCKVTHSSRGRRSLAGRQRSGRPVRARAASSSDQIQPALLPVMVRIAQQQTLVRQIHSLVPVWEIKERQPQAPLCHSNQHQHQRTKDLISGDYDLVKEKCQRAFCRNQQPEHHHGHRLVRLEHCDEAAVPEPDKSCPAARAEAAVRERQSCGATVTVVVRRGQISSQGQLQLSQPPQHHPGPQ